MTRRAWLPLLWFGLATAPAAWATVHLAASATPAARRPVARLVFEATLENDGAHERGQLVVEQLDLGAVRRVEMPLELAPQARKRLLVVFDTLPGGQDFELRFETEIGVLARSVVRVPGAGVRGQLVGVFGEVPGWLRRRSDARLRPVALDPTSLPASAIAWPDVDAILWPDPRASDLDEARATALRDWVRGGGRLLAGTAADQPLALRQLGFEDWPLVAERFVSVGFGEAARSKRDLARGEPEAGLALSPPEIEDGRAPNWLPNQSLFEMVCLSRMGLRQGAPEAPLKSVGLVLFAYLLLAGPGEWMSHRRAARRGRRRRFESLRRPLLLVSAVGAVLLLAGGLREDALQAVRIDLIDVDPESGIARGRSYLTLRRRGGDWIDVETPAGTHLSAGLGSHSASANWWADADEEPPRILKADPAAGAPQHRARCLPAQWAFVAWRIAFTPDAALVAEAGARARGELPPLPSARVDPRPLDAQASGDQRERWRQEHDQQLRSCWAPANSADLLTCVAASCNPIRYRHERERGPRQPDMEWPRDAAAWVAVEEGSRGPVLLVDGEPVIGSAFTVWRVLRKETGP